MNFKNIEEVKSRKFPDDNYIYPLKDEELSELRKSQYWSSEIEFSK